MVITKRIGIIGAGKIGEALISGLLRKKALTPERICASVAHKERCEYLSKTYNINCYLDNAKVVNHSDIIIIAVKPKDVKNVLEQVRETVTPEHLLISVAMGVTISYMQNCLGKDVPIIRSMPNTPILAGEGMTAISPAPAVSRENIDIAAEVFGAVGRVVEVEERLMNAVTGLSGSGPAYIYTVVEALTEAGVKVGLPVETARMLSAQTTLGSAKMVLETGEHPAKLREAVTTPGGSTVEGMFELEKGKLRASLVKAVLKAAMRAEELSK